MKLVVLMLLLLYTFFIAPGAGSQEDLLFQQLVTGQFNEVDPLVVTVFSMLGVYPIIFAMLLIPKDHYRWAAWPFVLFSFVLGAFSLLTYFIFRKNKTYDKPRGPKLLHKSLVHPISVSIVLIIAVSLYVNGSGGSLTAYQQAFMSSHLVSVMTIDLFVLIWLSYDVLKNEWNLRFSWLAFIPAIGPLVLLLKHKNLQQ
ncbi:hypothetical protein CR194_19535 [Salipaludibacillus keqinensis]|uniref:DUF2834 domain-containing protein n=1 Tax=Salipaludibacillus keqinensis TaxID=2045207 RepID=A0A323TCD6_9BACI|nr:hypothetical protein [Salipaludibacillus keqinensis]PYZ91527.1 hypothetical protein CR194_19535 [Salipaludibacillus keqinensis]